MSDFRLFLFGMPRLECDDAAQSDGVAGLPCRRWAAAPPRRSSRCSDLISTRRAPMPICATHCGGSSRGRPPLGWRSSRKPRVFWQDEIAWGDVMRFEAVLAVRRAYPHPAREVGVA
ncbi:MAG: hypothetical protein JXA33_21495 [Anaerolineae bacterium]|nr:hypothetical protein [Anaerolineae bacterium]